MLCHLVTLFFRCHHVTYRTSCHASGHLMIYRECYGFERAYFTLRHFSPHNSSCWFQGFLGAGSSTSKLAGLHADLWNIVLARLFIWIIRVMAVYLMKNSYGIWPLFTKDEHVRSLMFHPFDQRALQAVIDWCSNVRCRDSSTGFSRDSNCFRNRWVC